MVPTRKKTIKTTAQPNFLGFRAQLVWTTRKHCPTNLFPTISGPISSRWVASASEERSTLVSSAGGRAPAAAPLAIETWKKLRHVLTLLSISMIDMAQTSWTLKKINHQYYSKISKYVHLCPFYVQFWGSLGSFCHPNFEQFLFAPHWLWEGSRFQRSKNIATSPFPIFSPHMFFLSIMSPSTSNMEVRIPFREIKETHTQLTSWI